VSRWVVCSDPDCPELHQGPGRCPECRAAHEKQRPSKRERGYDLTYERAARDPTYRAATHCVTCGQPFTPDNPKTRGHSIAIRDGGEGSPILPECRRCNYGWRRTGS
jgi:hypothetical protein